jgi:hypothetical protein
LIKEVTAFGGPDAPLNGINGRTLVETRQVVLEPLMATADVPSDIQSDVRLKQDCRLLAGAPGKVRILQALVGKLPRDHAVQCVEHQKA